MSQWYPDRQHPTDRQIRNIEIRSRKYLFHCQRQRNKLQNNNDPKVLTILELVYINPHISTRQAEFQEPLFIEYYNQFDIILTTSFCTGISSLALDDHKMRAQFCKLARFSLDILEQNSEFFEMFRLKMKQHSNGCLKT